MIERRVALLIDGENISARHMAFAMGTAEARGRVTIRRVYGNLPASGQWVAMPGVRQMYTPSGKNAGDIALSLDALELALTDQADVFCIVTSDRDMSLVALRLRELGFAVTGIGEAAKSAPEFRAACTEFAAIPVAAPPATTPKEPQPARRPPFEDRLKTYLKKEGDTDGWVQLSALGQQRAKQQGISKAEAGITKSSSWIDWFNQHAGTFELEKRGTESRARLKSR